jgi:hypothetical protein
MRNVKYNCCVILLIIDSVEGNVTVNLQRPDSIFEMLGLMCSAQLGPACGVGTSPRTLEALIDLEPYHNLNRGGDDDSTMVESKVMDVRTSKAVGVIVNK